MNITKKGLIIGLIIGVAVGMHVVTTNCQTNPGGSTGCNPGLETWIAAIEFFVIIIPGMILSSLLPNTHSGSQIAGFIGSIISFGLLGLLAGWLISKLKRQ